MDVRLNSRQVRTKCADCSDMTLWRWLRDDASGFPKPVYVNKRRYWREGEVSAWWDNRDGNAAQSPSN